MEGWVDLVDFVAPRPGVEPVTFDHESDAKPLHHQDGRQKYEYWRPTTDLRAYSHILEKFKRPYLWHALSNSL